MNPKYIIALDQGTTSSRAIAFNKKGEIQHVAQKAFEQIFPQSGWVEHNPNEIWESQKSVLANVLSKLSIDDGIAEAIGITNQRETVVMWDRKTGEPLHNAIVWQDRRTAAFCDELKEKGLTEKIKRKTGLILDAYFSGTKAKWLLDNVPGAREKANAGEICLGTIDTWLIYKLTGGESFVTDVSNASRTLLFDIHSLSWDDELLALFDVPRQCLPKVCASSEIYAHTKREVVGYEIPIAGIAGDQQAALFGQMCTQPGMLKNTYGTGCFLLMNTGEKAVYSNNNLLTTVAWKIGDTTHYALEGSVFVGGAAVQWIRDGLELISDAREIEDMATAVPDNGGVYFVPALTGLGAPHWDPYARGAIVGLSRGTTKNHIARATLEGITYQVYDLVKAMEADAGQESKQLRVDGGAVANNFMMQFQANLFGFDVVRPQVLETTALGAAYLAGLAVGFWSMEELSQQWAIDKTFQRNVPQEETENLLSGWNNALPRAKNWIQKN